jgi:hypothetical protein
MIRTKSHLSGAGGALLLALVALDFAVLKGDEVFEVDVPATGGPPISIPVERVAEKHTLLLRTGGKYPLEWQLRDPEGREVASKRDITSKQGIRRYSFRPRIAGDYRLTVRHRGTGSPGSRIDVAMRVNDRRTISAWLDFH